MPYFFPCRLVRRGDVQSAWAGIRPLVRDPDKEDTQSLVRNHVVHLSKPGRLVTIAGGKWTTYRAMAVETLDRAVRELELPAKRQSQVLRATATDRQAVMQHMLLGSDLSRLYYCIYIYRLMGFSLKADMAGPPPCSSDLYRILEWIQK